MLLFNEKDKYTFSEIQEATSLPEDETKRYLISLSCGKAKVHPNAAVACIVVRSDATFSHAIRFFEKAPRGLQSRMMNRSRLIGNSRTSTGP